FGRELHAGNREVAGEPGVLATQGVVVDERDIVLVLVLVLVLHEGVGMTANGDLEAPRVLPVALALVRGPTSAGVVAARRALVLVRVVPRFDGLGEVDDGRHRRIVDAVDAPAPEIAPQDLGHFVVLEPEHPVAARGRYRDAR